MAMYVPYTWTDRQSEYPTRRILTWVDPETQQTKTLEVIVTRSEGTVSVEGDPFAATTMNGLESRINAGFATCSDILVSENSPTGADGKNGDIFIEIETTGNVTSVVAEYVKVSGAWIEMPTGGSSGSTVYMGTTDPDSSLGENGNLYAKYHLDSNTPVVDAFFVKISGSWASISTGGGSSYLELTQAQYDALTPEQKMNGTMYFITDTNGDEQQFQPVIYSTSEREIGVWTDGKPLYEKVVDLGTLPNNTTKNVAHNISNLGIIVSAEFTAKDSSGQYIQMPFTVALRDYINYQVSVYVTDTNIVIETGSNRSAYSGYAIIRYTKSTDTAGSGTWTPQGVPAVHYSTTEHVVGTWIDGSTVYEKTIMFESGVSLTRGSWTNVSAVSLSGNEDTFISTKALLPSHKSWASFAGKNNSGTFQIFSETAFTIQGVIIQYTKAIT